MIPFVIVCILIYIYLMISFVIVCILIYIYLMISFVIVCILIYISYDSICYCMYFDIYIL